MSLKDRIINAIINEAAPNAAASLIDEYLGGIDRKEVYAFLIKHRNDDWYDLIPERGKRAIKKLAPTDLDWLTCKWLVQNVSKTNPALASLFLGSPEMQNIVSDRLEAFKRRVTSEGHN